MILLDLVNQERAAVDRRHVSNTVDRMERAAARGREEALVAQVS